MNPLLLGAVPVLAVIIICFGYLSKSKERNTVAKARMIAKYRDRARKLENIIFGLPANYLPKTLRVLVYANIIDSLRQNLILSGQGDIDEQLARVKKTLATVVNIEPKQSAADTAAESGVALTDCKHLLQDLYSIIIEFHSEGAMDKNTAQAQLREVRKAILLVVLDTYKDAADAASSGNNHGLALHYCSTVLIRLNQDPTLIGLDKEKAYFTERVRQLEQQLQNQNQYSGAQHAPEEAVMAEWQALDQPDDSWKKRRF
jgi:hypothetical protein